MNYPTLIFMAIVLLFFIVGCESTPRVDIVKEPVYIEQCTLVHQYAGEAPQPRDIKVETIVIDERAYTAFLYPEWLKFSGYVQEMKAYIEKQNNVIEFYRSQEVEDGDNR